MSLGSPADIIPFTRFLECRERLRRIGAANGTVVIPASTHGGMQPDVAETANAFGACGGLATVHAATPHGGTGRV